VKANQTEQEEIGRSKLLDAQDLVASLPHTQLEVTLGSTCRTVRKSENGYLQVDTAIQEILKKFYGQSKKQNLCQTIRGSLSFSKILYGSACELVDLACVWP